MTKLDSTSKHFIADIYDWLKSNSVEFPYKMEHASIIYNFLIHYVDQAEKDNNDLWVDYFLDINFGKTNVKKMMDYWDYAYFTEKTSLIKKGIFEDILFKCFMLSAEKDVYVSSIAFIGDNFFYQTNILEAGFKAIIQDVLLKNDFTR